LTASKHHANQQTTTNRASFNISFSFPFRMNPACGRKNVTATSPLRQAAEHVNIVIPVDFNPVCGAAGTSRRGMIFE
jgi:hypothetical protein